MQPIFRILCLLFTSLISIALPGVSAQDRAPHSPASRPVIIEYYYKVVPGGMMPGGPSEWLALYQKNHHPILRQLAKEGFILSEKAYERKFHAESPAWDYKVVMVWRDWSALEEANKREPEIMRSLFPDKEEHDREEKRRWELTESHWDDVIKEVPLD